MNINLQIENSFMFDFFPNIKNKIISLEEAFIIVKFLKIYKEKYTTYKFVYYNYKNIICTLNYCNNDWLILDDSFNFFNVNIENKFFYEKCTNMNDTNDEYYDNIINTINEIKEINMYKN